MISKTIKSSLIKKPFIKSTVTLFSGNAFAQIIILLSIPIITRLYSPATYGIFGIILAAITIMSSVAHLRYHIASLLPKEHDDADTLILLSILTSFFFAAILLVVIVLLKQQIADLLSLTGHENLLYFIPIGTLFATQVHIFNIRYLRDKFFYKLSLSKVGGALSGRIIAIVLGFVSPVAGWLVLSKLVEEICIVSILLMKNFRDFIGSVFSQQSFSTLKKVAIRYKEYPKYCYTDLLILLTRDLPIFLLGAIFTPQVVGFYVLTKRVLNNPSFLLGDAIRRSFYSHIADLRHDRSSCRVLVSKVFRNLAILTIFPLIVLPLFLSELFVFFFGEAWEPASIYAIEMLPLFGFTFMLMPSNAVFDVYERQKERFVYSVVFFLAVLLAFLIGGIVHNSHVCLILFSTLGSVVLLRRTAYILKITGADINIYLRDLGKIFLTAILLICPAYFIKFTSHYSFVLVILLTSLAAVAYIFIFFKGKVMQIFQSIRVSRGGEG